MKGGPTILVLIVIFAMSFTASAQEDEVTTQNWFDFYPYFYLDEKLQYRGDLGFRFTHDFTWFTAYIRPNFRYYLSQLVQIDLGASLFSEYNKDISNKLELRISQGIRVVWPRFERVKFYSLFRYEQRIFWHTQEDWRNEIALRFRYKLGSSIPLALKEIRYWYVPFYLELFFDVGEINERFGNRARGSVGFGYVFDKLWRGELIAVVQRSDNNVEGGRSTDILIQLKVRKLIASRDYQSKSTNEDIMIED